MNASHDVLEKFMREQAVVRKAEARAQLALGEEGSRDIASLLARANELEAQGGKLTLDDQEMVRLLLSKAMPCSGCFSCHT